jgi:hypothetical protein
MERIPSELERSRDVKGLRVLPSERPHRGLADPVGRSQVERLVDRIDADDR